MVVIQTFQDTRLEKDFRSAFVIDMDKPFSGRKNLEKFSSKVWQLPGFEG